MPNKHASIKDLRKSAKRAAHNKRIKTHIKSLTKQLDMLLHNGKKEEALTLSRAVQQIIGKAAKTHVFHANKSARRISAMHKSLQKIA